jgi:Domain of unknown function (DUF4815)
MGLTTDFNQSPYFDDFDETKNYHKVLFKPATAVQARELTQLQTILQNQIERFGDNILVEGTIVKGGNFVEENPLPYVKIRDIARNTSGGEVATDVNLYTEMKAIGLTTGVEAIVVATAFGLESQTPNLSTLFVKYTKGAVTSDINVSNFSTTEEIQLYSKDASGDYVVPFHRVTAAGVIEGSAAVGNGYGVRCGDGVIYQKGHFIRFENALTVVSKYSNTPDGIVVGFQTEELLVDSNSDSSLLDNANGFNNENAPGADRLKLSPSLIVKPVNEVDETFFAIQEYSNGRIVRRKISTQYNVIEKNLERRTLEESGNYVVNRFPVRVEPSTNTSNLSVVIGPGLGYVEGKRVELLSDIAIDIPEASTYVTSAQQNINTNYGSYVVVSSYVGRFDFTTFEQVNLRNSSNTVIGTALVRAVTRNGGIAGQYRLYLFRIIMNSGASFNNVNNVVSASGLGTANLVLETVAGVANTAVLKDASFLRSIFPIGKSFIRSVDGPTTDYTYRTSQQVTTTTSTFNITLSGSDVFPYTASGSLNSDELAEIMVVAHASVGTVTSGEVMAISSATLDSSGKVITITTVKNPGASLTVTAYINVKRTQTTINAKTLETVYVKIQANTNVGTTTGTYSLGLPDAYSIEGVWKSANTVAWATIEGYATSNSSTDNYTSFFALDKKQSDALYELSGIKKRKTITINTNDKLIVKAKVFKKDSNPGHFFTVDSYPVDDATSVLPADKIRTEDIPVFVSSNQTKYYLRDAVDLRPYVSNTAAYATTASAATVNPATTTAFSNILFPAPNKTIEATYSYYLGRNDIIVADNNGEFVTIQGTPAENPTYPPEPTKGMLLARVYVPPYPSLAASRANQIGKPEYGVSISSNQAKRYTMKDIGGIDNRLRNLEYYTSLSLLETQAKDFLIADSNGLDRFKNGIFVDNFDTLYLADVNGGEFYAAIDPSNKDIHPGFRQYSLGLKYKSGTNITSFANTVATLSKSDYVLTSVSQPYATNVKSCTTSFYNFAGKMSIYPEYDSGPDTVRAPDVNFNFDLATPFIEFTDLLSQFVPLTRTDVSSVSNTVRGGGLFGTGLFASRTTTTTTTTTTSTLNTGAGQEETQQVGDFVTDVNFSPFMRSRLVQVKVVGLRPSTRFYFFFDGKDVNAHVAKGVVAADGSIIPSSTYGGQVVTSTADGVLYAVFRIPAETFYVGDRTLEIMDIATYENKDVATSFASAKYSGFNFSAAKTGLSSTTRPPTFNIDRVSTSVTTTTRRGGSDPLAQTFIIDSDSSSDTDVFITKLDLYFARKSRAGKGVGVQIREVDNGYPAGNALPFSSVYLTAAQVNAPSAAAATNALTATTITFQAPVALKTNTEYAIVIAPDGNDPDYLMWISRTGGNDIDTGVAIQQDTNAGVLFTSTNNKAWTPYQNENLKFKMYAATFASATGSITLTNKDHEFLDLNNLSGNYVNGEYVFINKTSYNTGTVSVTAGNTTVSGVGTSFTSQYAQGEHIVVKISGTNFEVLEIASIASNTSMTVKSIPKQSASAIAQHYSSPVGKVAYINTSEPVLLILEDSTSKSSTFKFTALDNIVGADSGATSQIQTVRNLPISYVQPAIYRTNFTKTRTNLRATKLFNGTSENNQKDLAFNDTNYLTDATYYIKSKSNDFTSSGFELTVDMQNTSLTTKDTSPVIDYDISTVMLAEYRINNLATSDVTENTSLGGATSKYVSKRVELADGLDAEDIRVLIGAYKPSLTDLRVYVKFQASTDIRSWNDVEWTQLAVKPETNAISSLANRYDYREYEYSLGTTAKLAGEGAWLNNGTLNYIDPTGAVYTSYKYFAVKIVMLSTGHNIVPRVKDLRAIALT